MSREIRNLKIVRTFSASPRAHLPLSGRWLEQAGFKIGMEVNVIVRNECLIILPKAAEVEANKAMVREEGLA